jgi:HSP20 family molecular chaperone IbpA
MEIPGMKKEDIKIQYDKDNQTLSISGIKRT